jgi:hypothetical protein
MKKGKEQIDLLLEQNETELLSGVNWNQLQSSVSKKLDDADSNQTSIIKYWRMFKVASGIVAAAAAVIFIAVMIKNNIQTEVKFENRKKGMVAFIEDKGSTNVEILDSNKQNDKTNDQTSWIIIRMSEPKVADNGHDRDEMDFACLM